MPIRSYAFEMDWGIFTIPITGTDSNILGVPKDAKAMALYIPALEGATTLKIQSMVPRVDLEGAAEVFMDVYAFDPGDGTMTLVGLLVGPDRCVVIPTAGMSGGAIKLVASGAQTSAARTIVAAWYGFQG